MPHQVGLRMKIIRHEHVTSFVERAGTWLERTEAENNLILGICSGLANHPDRFEADPYLLTIEERNSVIGAALMTPPHKLTITRMPQAAAAELVNYVLDNSIDVPGVFGTSEEAKAFAECWSAKTGRACQLTMNQRMYKCNDVIEPTWCPGRLRLAETNDEELLVKWCRESTLEIGIDEDLDRCQQGVQQMIADARLVIWEQGQVVSCAAYGAETANAVRIFFVYTPAPLRRKGLATSCVAALTQMLLTSGKQYCLLYTDLANPTSNRIYQKIGYRPICNSQMWTFSD